MKNIICLNYRNWSLPATMISPKTDFSLRVQYNQPDIRYTMYDKLHAKHTVNAEPIVVRVTDWEKIICFFPTIS